MSSETTRKVGLLACVGTVVGAIGPWQTTFLVDLAGTDGDGVITLVLGSLAGLLLLTKQPGSGCSPSPECWRVLVRWSRPMT